MAQGIDFLKLRREISAKQTRFLRLLKTGSLVLLIAYCLVAAIIFSYWVYLRRENQTIKTQTAASKQKISELKKTESLQIILKQRLSSLDKFFSQKSVDYSRSLSFLEDVSVTGIFLKELDLNQEGRVILAGSATDAVALSNFLENLSSENSKDLFSKIVLSSASRGKDGDYNFSLLMEASEKPKP